MNAIVDTGFLVAFLSHSDRHNGWAVEIAPQLKTPFLTCEAVLAETAFHMKSATPVLDLVRTGALKVAFNAQHELPHLRQLAARYEDRHPDFADLCLIRMSELYPDHVVITIDQNDFRIYRRNRRDVIPVLCPPRLQ